MTTNDEPLKRYYNSDKEKSEIDSEIGVKKLDNDFLHIWVVEIVFYKQLLSLKTLATR